MIHFKENETENQALWRIGELKYNELIDMTWEEIALEFNKQFREDETEYYDSSAYRKRYKNFKDAQLQIFGQINNDEEYLKIQDAIRELERAKIQFRDERNAWNKQNYADARVTQKLDYLEEVIKNQNNTPLDIKVKESNVQKTAIVCCSDWHIGEDYDNEWGVYNSDIAKNRIEAYLAEVVTICNQNNVGNIVVCSVGDMLSGNIHHAIAVSNRENVIEQIMLAAELMKSFIESLCIHGYKVSFINVAGNHTRIAKKDDSLKDERLDNLIGWYVNSHLKRYPNFNFIPTSECTLGEFEVYGNKYMCCHGDYDGFSKNGLANLVLSKGYKPTAIFFGHYHTMAMSDLYDVKLIRSGCLGGSGDDYTIQRRLKSKPSQTVVIADGNGVNTFYNVTLN